MVYNKVNPIFHHWSLGDCKFGLTFQSPAEADEFQKGLLAALAALSRGQWCKAQMPSLGNRHRRSWGLGTHICLSPCSRLTHSLLFLFLLLPFPGHCRDPLPSDGESWGLPWVCGGGSSLQIFLNTCCGAGKRPHTGNTKSGPN